jgi:hypothetical protein
MSQRFLLRTAFEGSLKQDTRVIVLVAWDNA